MNTAEHQVDEMRKFLETYKPIEDAGEGRRTIIDLKDKIMMEVA